MATISEMKVNGNNRLIMDKQARGDIDDIKNNSNFFNIYGHPMTHKPVNENNAGMVFNTASDGTITAVGSTTSSTCACNLWYFTDLAAAGFKGGDRILMCQYSTKPNALYMELFAKETGGSLTHIYTMASYNGYKTYMLPNNVEALLFRVYAAANIQLNDTICAGFLTAPNEDNNYTVNTNGDRPLGYNALATAWGGVTVDLNDVLDNSFNLITDAGTYLHLPSGFSLGFLHSIHTGTWHLHLLYSFNGGTVYKRRGTPDGSTWEEWQTISGGGNVYNITNEYSFPETSQTVNLSCSPEITTDTNNYLATTGDTTDRTADILAMLTASKVCRLGPGLFCISNLQMPDESMLIGSGYSTEVRMSGSSDGFAVKMGSRCAVKDLRLTGGATDPTLGPTIGGRHGILWQGDYTEHTTAPWTAIVSNLWIRGFSGGGITCYDTGYGTANALEVTNVYILACWAGINISYWSEFHKFTNVRCAWCYVGCVNNGGNNVFVNCDFSNSKEIGMLMDNSQGQSPNNTHGSAIGCVFNHTDHDGVTNSGIGIKILNCHNGFMFSGCQIFFSQINIVDSDGIVIAETNFGLNNCDVSVSGGGAILFANNMVQGAVPISITNNTKTHFVNCYNRETGAAWGN